MSVTVRDLLKLPSLCNAEVVAGHKGLDKIVVSLSVLEGVNPDLIQSYAFKNDDIGGSEIVITGFLNAATDEEVQYRSIRNLCESGEAGIIIYYVGIFVPEISKRILRYADEQGFVVICMPKNQPNLRYGDAISDIMGAIIRDRERNDRIVVDLLDTIAGLSSEKQNVGTIIRLLAERLHVSVVLTDRDFTALYEAAWPVEFKGIHKYIVKDKIPSENEGKRDFSDIPGGIIQRKKVSSFGSIRELFLIPIGRSLPENVVTQAAEAVRIAINIWDQKRDDAAISELIKAILDDEPIKMRSLASLFRIDVASINAMWIFSGENIVRESSKELSQFAAAYCGTSFADVLEDKLLLFTSGFRELQDAYTILTEAEKMLGPGHAAVYFTNLRSTSDVREAWLLHSKAVSDLIKAMPGKKMHTHEDLLFIEDCQETIAGGEEMIRKVLLPLEPLKDRRDVPGLIETLSVYLLDCDSSISKTAGRLSVHTNTVKYRIRCIKDALGYPPGSMPTSMNLYKALAVKRLIET